MNLSLKPRHASTLLLIITVFWGTSFPIIKFLEPTIDPVVLMAFRFTIATVLCGAWFIFRGRNPFHKFRFGLLTGVLMWLLMVPQMMGLRYTTASNSAFITGLFIVFVPMFSLAVHHKWPAFEQCVAMILALMGLWGLTGGVKSANIGDLLTLGSACACGAYMVAVEICTHSTDDWLALGFQQFFVVAILGTMQVLLSGLPVAIPDIRTAAAIIYLSVFVTLIALCSQTWAQRHITPMKASFIFILEPVVAAFIAFFWLDENFSTERLLGAALVLVALVISALPLQRFIQERDR